MNILDALEAKVGLPEDSEAVRKQKAIAIAAGLGATLLILAQTLLFVAVDAPEISRIYIAYLISFALLVAAPLIRPRAFPAAVVLVGIVSCATNLAAHGASGGYSGGLWFLAWFVIIPLSMFLAGSSRIGISFALLSAVLCLVAAFLEPAFAGRAFAMPPVARVISNTFVVLAIMAVCSGWSFYFVNQLDAARDRADSLLLNVLPAPIAARLKHDASTIADGFREVTILFADIVNFTALSADADPVVVVSFLNDIFSDFDDLAARHGLEKIKTVGDAYMVAGGLPVPRADHCEAVVAFGLDMLATAQRHIAWNGGPVKLRVGVNTGPVVAGVIGRRKFIYDLWGDAVNTASRMESNGLADFIQVTAAVRDRLAGKYTFEARPPMPIKGKGDMITYILRPQA